MMEGSLSKWTNVMKGWQYRWFVLDENAGLLSYYTVSDVSIASYYLLISYCFAGYITIPCMVQVLHVTKLNEHS